MKFSICLNRRIFVMDTPDAWPYIKSIIKLFYCYSPSVYPQIIVKKICNVIIRIQLQDETLELIVIRKESNPPLDSTSGFMNTSGFI